jgi:hypothetical protein
MRKLLILLMILPTLAGAQTGRDDYRLACGNCHGADATGNGPAAKKKGFDAPDLTGLSRANGGSFPRERMRLLIDGRSGDRGHGYPMPVWGDRFRALSGHKTGTPEAEAEIRARIDGILDYLESVQR